MMAPACTDHGPGASPGIDRRAGWTEFIKSVAAGVSPSTSLGVLTHSTLLRVILSLPAVSQTLS